MDVDVGVFGATGYAGRELVRILGVHPRARVAFTTGTGEGHLAHEAGLEREADAYFLSLPHGISATFAARLRAAHPSAVVVDLSGDLRLPTAAAYREWYGHDHPAPELLGQAPYGLTELYRDEIRDRSRPRAPGGPALLRGRGRFFRLCPRPRPSARGRDGSGGAREDGP